MSVKTILAGLLPPDTPITDDSDLSQYGLSSLTMTRLWFLLRKEYGVDLPVTEIAACATVHALDERVAAARTAADAAGPTVAVPLVRAAPQARHEPFPLTDLQQAYLVAKGTEAGGDPVGCHVYREFDVPDLDVERLLRAWQRVIARHDMLRAEITIDGRQRIQPELPQVTPRRYDDPEQARAELSHHRYLPGDLPLWTVAVSGDRFIHLSIDVLLIDGHGLAVLLHDWWRWYEEPDWSPAPAGGGTLTVRDCLADLAAQRRGPDHAGHLAYWADRLRELPQGPGAEHLSAAAERLGEVTAASGGTFTSMCRRTPLTATLATTEWDEVRALAEQWRVSPTSIVLTLFAEAFHAHHIDRPFSLLLTTNDRARLPAEAQTLLGPFTSSMVMPMPATAELALPEAVGLVHRQLWRDLDHAAVSGVAALRQVRSRAALPVVFTSMLDLGVESGLAARTSYAISQTTGVTLDHQMWEQNGELHIRWDVIEEAFPAGEARTLFARFVNTLRHLTTRQQRTEPLNELQQSYYVPRVTNGPGPWDGCQVYHSFELTELDLDRLERAWLRLVAAYEVLRTVVSHDGRLQISPAVPRNWQIPVIDLAAGVDRRAYRDGLARTLVSRAFPLGRSPQAELRVSTDAGAATLHLVTDLTIIDGRSIHFLVRELLRHYADPGAALRSAVPPAPGQVAVSPAEEVPAVPDGAASPVVPPHPAAHWGARISSLPPGPQLVGSGSQRPARVRREGRLTGWAAVRRQAEQAGLTPDDLMAAALTEVLARNHPTPFSVPVVRWTVDGDTRRPGEQTVLSWVTRQAADTALWQQAEQFRQVIDEDAHHESVSGLGELRKRVNLARRSGPYSLPVVYTSLLDLRAQPLPPGITLGPWLTCTPDVSLDCIAIEESSPELGGELRFYWDAVEEHFPPGQLDEMFAGYSALLEALCWNQTRREFTADGPVHRLFEQQVRQRPDAVALRWSGGGSMTYAELNRQANRVAWELRARGVGPETPVGVSVPRGPAMAVAVFGILKAGGYYVPVEPALPAERAHRMLTDAAAALLLTAAGRAGWAVPDGVEAIPVESCAGPQHDPDPVNTADSTAYVIFTSGSTGQPKGVAVAHRALHNLFAWCYRTHGFGPGDLGLCVTSLGFDLSVFDLLGLLGCGAGLYLADGAEQRDPQLILEVLLREPVTFWNSAPTSLHQLAPLLAGVRDRPGAGHLRLVYLSGDYTPLTLPDAVRAVFPKAQLVSLGGATEATVWSNFFEIGEIDPSWRSIPYGRPIDNSQYYVLDEALRPCPVGVEGDLYIAGECLSLGYHRQPELTADRFVVVPIGVPPGSPPDADRMYRTGDRASYFPDGVICFRGRSDNQVKIRGFRVELAEIEHRLRTHPAVTDVVVLARGDHTGDRKLVAYLVTADGAKPEVGQLREYAAQTLPDYMVPNVVVFVDIFPATVNGKLDRDSLPWPVESGSSHLLAGRAGRSVDPLPPVGALAEGFPTGITVTELAAVFAELLGVESVDPEVDVWNQGATSFTMVQVSALLQRRHGRRVPVSVLLDRPTVTGIAAGINGTDPQAAPVAPQSTAPQPLPSASPAEPAPPPEVVELDFFSAIDRARFKQARHDLRRARPGETVLALPPVAVDDAYFDWRVTHREFGEQSIPAEQFSRFLAVLRETNRDGRWRRLYPSAGDTYPVQVYLHLKVDAVADLAAGFYYYDPVEHTLQLIDPTPETDRSDHFVYNRPVFDQSRFAVFLFGNAAAIEPLYGAESHRFMLLEAGYLGQSLMLGQAAAGIGLCPIGSLVLEPIIERLGLTGEHRFLQAFLAGPVAPTRAAIAARAPSPDEIAIIGLAGRYPGADDLDTFWRNLCHGSRSLSPAPDRAGADPMLLGGFLTDAESFDSLLFHVSPREAEQLDPQLRLLLHSVWQCLEDAGYTRRALEENGRTGVFLGAMWTDYRQVGTDRWREGESALVSATASEAANRISHYFGFDGPSIAVDTSCSSSLAALHLAVQSLQRGECDAAIVAAVNLLTHPYHLELLKDLGLLAERVAEGAFDPGTPGWSPGEGVAAVLLRPHRLAVRDNDQVYAVLERTAIGHTGGSGRFGVPDAAALTRSISETLAAAGRTTEEIGYIECGAAGAAMADAAEAEALSAVFSGRREPVPMGTVKPNIGHLEAAAGLSQLTKVLLQLRDRRLAPTVLATTGNPLIRWDGIRPVTALTKWSGPRRALINAMGATGSYGHVLLRGPDPGSTGARTVAEQVVGDQAVLLSAASHEQLVTAASRLYRHLAEHRPALADVAYTLCAGREPRSVRLAITCSDLAGLRAGLEIFGRGGHQPGVVQTSTVEPGPRAAGDPPLRSHLTLAEAIQDWLTGHEVDFAPFVARGAHRISLPTYPFAAEPVRPAGVPHRTADSMAGAPAAAEPLAPTGTDDDPGRDAVRVQADPGRVEEMITYLKDVYAGLSGIPAERLHARVPLEQYGLTSLLITQLNERLATDLDEVSTTLFFEHPDLAGVARTLAGRGSAGTAATGQGTAHRGTADRVTTDGPTPIAIIGIAGRYPKAAELAEFWRNLHAGRDVISPLPIGRRGDAGAGADLMVGGFLDDVALFDPLFFGITPRDAVVMDPQERLFLEVAWHAVEDAGYTRQKFQQRHGGAAGVFVGSMYNEYPFLAVERGFDGVDPIGSAVGGIANRVSYLLDLHGPSMTVDTMCSSSLTAVHLAVASLRRNECSVAIVGGVNLALHANKFRQLRALQMAATDHRCRSFGAGGDGFVPGEGVGAVLLKPLAAAVADGDRIHGVITGTAINHDGRTNGYTVPSPVAQGELIAAALRDAGIPADGIGYVEAHGTGTALGDPVEINGLSRAYQGLLAGSCAIGSVKSQIGHLEAAAGIAGLTKVLLQFRHRTMVPSLHADELNPNIDWPAVPFRVQREAVPWPALTPRRAAISSFGAGGANAHLIVEAYEQPVLPAVADTPQLFVLSARTEAQLRAICDRLANFLNDHPMVRLVDVAHTLRTGREPLKERFAVIAASGAELREKLAAFDGMHGRAEPSTGGQGPAEGGLAQLARHWLTGGAVRWPDQGGVLIELPGYPFTGLRCWPWSTVTGPPAPLSDRGTPVPSVVAALPVGQAPVVAAGSTGPAIPLLIRDWAPAHRPASVPRAGIVACLHHPSQRELVSALAEVIAPVRLSAVPNGAELPAEVTGWLDLRALAEPPKADDADWGARLAELRSFLGRRPRGGVRVMQVTRGLLSMAGGRPSLAGARLAGFVRSLGAELPWAQSTVVDVESVDPWTLRELAAEWHATDAAGEICLRAGQRYRAQWSSLPDEVGGSNVPVVYRPDPSRTYVITGATRGLGALAARHLVERGARRLALLGIRPLDEAARARIAWLRDQGAQVEIHLGSLADRDELAAFLDRVRVETGELAGVLHCAGRSSSGGPQFLRKTTGGIAEVLQPKADGLDVLTDLTGDDLLDFFVLYSSAAAAIPMLAAGVADYAAANSYLDYATGYQLRQGRTWFRSVNWPVWRDTGGGVDRPDACAGAGLDALPDEVGLAVLDRVMALPAGAVVLPWYGLSGRAVPGGADLLSVNRLRVAADADAGASPSPDDSVSPDIDVSPSASSDAKASAGAEWLTELFAEALGMPETELDARDTFGDLGVESVLLMELVERIEARLGRPVEPGLLLRYDTVEKLAGHLGPAPGSRSGPRLGAPPPSAGQQRPSSEMFEWEDDGADQRIAVIGMACRFPGAEDLGAFWRLLTDGVCGVTEVPPGRWDVRRLFKPGVPGFSISRWGGFLTGLEDFDPGFFQMSDEEARDLDPAIRLTLEATASCLRDAGYVDAEVRGREVGVFMGARMSQYRRRICVESASSRLGGDQNFIAARVAHHYDLRGPNLVVDSACSSALVSVQLAVQSLLAGESELALAGGVEVLLDEEPYLEFSAAKALSPTGRCATFSREADGFVPGEGCGVLLLKRLDRALGDGDRIHAVINAVAVGNDGRTMGLTTPNPQAQAQVVRRALTRAGVRAEDVAMVEAHGTATMIGDPIELRALTEVFREQTGRTGFCAVGSVKSNLGHLLSAAGIAGLIKVLLSVEHGQIPPTLFCDEPQPRFDFASSPFIAHTVLSDWPAGAPGRPRAAGVSAFGLGGTNAHAIVTDLAKPERSVRRSALPAPVFQRRRLWWDREPAPTDAGAPAASDGPVPPVPPAGDAPVADMLRLTFI